MTSLRAVAIAGVGITRFDRYDGSKGRPNKEYSDLGSEAVAAALDEAGILWHRVDAAYCGSVYCGTASGHQTLYKIGMTAIPIINIENACSSSSSAFRLAYYAIATGQYDVVLAAGFEQMPRGFIPSTSWPYWQRLMGFNVQPASYALKAVRYMEQTGATEEDFARVTVKNRKNGALNPNARFQKPVSLEEVLASRMIASPLRKLHACPLADGGSAVILCSLDRLVHKTRVVTVKASVHTTGSYGHEKGGGSVRIKTPNNVELCAAQAWENAGVGPREVEVVQAYDTMAAAELWDLEELGLCEPGQAPRLLREGVFDIGGRLPVNTDGGLMSRGHPLGATGLAQIIEIYRQLRGEAGPRQTGDPKIGLAHCRGAVSNSIITILER